METLIDRLMARASGNATQLTAGTDTLPKAAGAGILFVSADTLASHAQGAAYDGAAEEFQQDHGAAIVPEGKRDHA